MRAVFSPRFTTFQRVYGSSAFEAGFMTASTGARRTFDELALLRAHGELGAYAKTIGVRGLEAALSVTGPIRRLPDFLAIGAMRAGTTSMYHYLAQHPRIRRPLHKEVNYFSGFYYKGPNWYRGHFPIRKPTGTHAPNLTFEASPSYLFHPLAAERARVLIPNVKAVALLRDPVGRAWSHYGMNISRGFETEEFSVALDREEARLAGAEARVVADISYDSMSRRRFSYQAKGLYAEQLRRWFDALGPDRVLVLRSEDLYTDPSAAVRDVTTFLGLPDGPLSDPRPRSYPIRASLANQRMADRDRARLIEYFKEPNRQLFELLGRDLGWPTA